ncbi:MAG: hypothetical protein SCK70_16095, partial [bacterium]|nr:hypothetical protein [bacterium]
NHISTYCLTVEPDTALAQKVATNQIITASEETERKMYLLSIDFLMSHGFRQYEISNFSLPNWQCRHNQIYWQLSPYLGIGPSAHSYWRHHRHWNLCDLHQYIEKLNRAQSPIEDEEFLTPQQQQFEYIMLQLRTTSGLNLSHFQTSFQKSFLTQYAKILQCLDRHPEKPLYQLGNGRFMLTNQGLVLYDEICSLFD